MAKNKNSAPNDNIYNNINNQTANQYYVYNPELGYVPVDFSGINQAGMNFDPTNQVGSNPNYQAGYNNFQVPPNFNQPYANPYMCNPYARQNMQNSHIMQMNAMQEQINNMQAFIQATMQNNTQNGMPNNMQNGTTQNNLNSMLSPEKLQEIYATIDEVASGKAGPEKLLSFMQNTSGDFIKGLAIGAGAILLYNCTPLKDMLASLVGSGLAGFMPKKDDGFDDEFDSEYDENSCNAHDNN